MKTRNAHPIGIAWVTLIFLSIPVVLLVLDYDALGPPAVSVLLVMIASGVSTFAVISVLFWVSQLRAPRLPRGWYRIRRVESRAMYRSLGVIRFRRWLLGSPFRALNQSVHLAGRSRADLVSLGRRMEEAEANHVIALVVTGLLTPVYAIVNTAAFVPFLVGFNVVGNLYPILLQRMNRMKVERVLAKLEGAAQG